MAWEIISTVGPVQFIQMARPGGGLKKCVIGQEIYNGPNGVPMVEATKAVPSVSDSRACGNLPFPAIRIGLSTKRDESDLVSKTRQK